MANRADRENARLTRDDVDRKAAGLGHTLVWTLSPLANRRGHAFYFIGTCGQCGGNAHAGASWSSSSSVLDCRRHECSGPGTHVLTEIEMRRFNEVLQPAIGALAAAARRTTAVHN